MRIQENIQLSKYCTFKIGGPAPYLIDWQSPNEITEICQFAKDKQLPIFVFGGGSNLLFPDQGLEAVVARCMLNKISYQEKLLNCEAGVRWPLVKIFCKQKKLYGIEPLYGLPGTVGGSVVGNAGCHGQEIIDVLSAVKYFNLKTGKFHKYTPNNDDFDYRWSVFKEKRHWLVTNALLRVSDEQGGQAGTPQEFADFRAKKQPQGLTTGSFFKNPYPDYAGALLEQAGLKGYRVGGVAFSEKHANFVVNDGEGTAADVKQLIKDAQAKVKAKFDIELKPEVQIVDQSHLNYCS